MKSMIIMLGTLMASSCYAQHLKEGEVPTPVKQAFEKTHPSVKKVTWEKENEYYEAEYKVDKREQSVLMDKSGNVVQTETEIHSAELPAAVRDYVAKNFGGAKITEASKLVDAAGVITYEAEVKGKDLIFDNQGAYLSTEAGEDHDKD